MAFPSAFENDPINVRSGERVGQNISVLGTTQYASDLVPGRFAQVVGGTVSNIDGTATPVIAGIPLREVTGDVESAGEYNANIFGQIEYGHRGMFTVQAVTGQDPSLHQALFIHNLADADAGKATTTDSADTVAANAEFIRDLGGDVWMVYVG